MKEEFYSHIAEKFSGWLNTHEGFILCYKNRVIGFCLSTGNLVKKQGSFPFLFDIVPNGQFCYGFGDYIIPEMRGLGMNTILMQYRLYKMKIKGYKKEFGFVDIKNVPQTKIMKRYGYEKYGSLYFKKILWKTTKKMSVKEECCKIFLN